MHATRRVMLEHLDEPDLAAHGHGRRGVAEIGERALGRRAVVRGGSGLDQRRYIPP